MQIKRGRLSIGAPVEPKSEITLSSEEEAAFAILCSIYEEGGIDVTALSIERTKGYLKIVYKPYYALCNLKLRGDIQPENILRYIELPLWHHDKKRLRDDPRFCNIAGFATSQKKFTRLPLSNVEDICAYRDAILLAFAWVTPKA